MQSDGHMVFYVGLDYDAYMIRTYKFFSAKYSRGVVMRSFFGMESEEEISVKEIFDHVKQVLLLVINDLRMASHSHWVTMETVPSHRIF